MSKATLRSPDSSAGQSLKPQPGTAFRSARLLALQGVRSAVMMMFVPKRSAV